jgi:hypothetical protein
MLAGLLRASPARTLLLGIVTVALAATVGRASPSRSIFGSKAKTLDPAHYRVRCVAYGLPPGGFATFMGVSAPYYTSGLVAFPEGVAREVTLTMADETVQFIILFYEERAEAAIKAQYGTDVSDAAWTALEAGAKEAGYMADPVQFTYMDASALYGAGTAEVTIPAPGSAMPLLPGWPAAFPSIEGAIVQSDAPVNAKGVYEGVEISAKWSE